MPSMERESLAIQASLKKFGLALVQAEPTGLFFHSASNETAILIDIGICNLRDYPYVDYTTRQNQLSHLYRKTFRFLYSQDSNISALEQELGLFLNGDDPDPGLKAWGRNRETQDPDPTPPEARFESMFAEAFGQSALRSLRRETPHYDRSGSRRFVDYELLTTNMNFAIELNGESFHHPALTGPKRYRSQLFKQNSLVAEGFKVFRWSLRGMRDRERMIREVQTFFGSSDSFIEKPLLTVPRALSTIDLMEHQVDALAAIEQARGEGQDTFLVVRPTGTGKTEIFIADIARVQANSNEFAALVIVPTRSLRRQTIDRFRQRLPELLATDDMSCSAEKRVIVQTSAYMTRRFNELEPDLFDYIVVDEAHHAMATGLRRVVQHFTPQNLLGVTATPTRLDRKELQDVFGEYESALSLENAVESNLIPPIRCFRIQSNVDLSQVRFNGHDYTASDLQKTVVIPSRDALVADTLVKYFGPPLESKQGVVFCVNIAHAKRMAKALTEAGIPSLAVSGADRTGTAKAMTQYDQGAVRFLCACDLLTEGWDSPRTTILVMARPTFSQALYTQQIGRGTRHFPGKEALYVLDVVDNYGAGLVPLSLHSLLGVGQYMPFADVVGTGSGGADDEVVVLDGLHEGVRRIEPINIFNYEKIYGDFLNEEQLARELYISTGTVKEWIRKGLVAPDHVVVFGRRRLRFFDPENVDRIRKERNLSEHTEATRKNDFIEFVKAGDYTFSYKMIFMLSFLKHMNPRGEAPLDDIVEDYGSFYKRLLAKAGKCDKDNSPYNVAEYLEDEAGLTRNLLQNPFEKFERKRFMYHCKDLNYLGLDGTLLRELTDSDFSFVRKKVTKDLVDYFGRADIGYSEDDIQAFSSS